MTEIEKKIEALSEKEAKAVIKEIMECCFLGGKEISNDNEKLITGHDLGTLGMDVVAVMNSNDIITDEQYKLLNAGGE